MAKNLSVLTKEEFIESCSSMKGKVDTVGRRIEHGVIINFLELFSGNFRVAVVVAQNLETNTAFPLNENSTYADDPLLDNIRKHYVDEKDEYVDLFNRKSAKSFTSVVAKVMNHLEGVTIQGIGIPNKHLSASDHSKVLSAVKTFINNKFTATESRATAANQSKVQFAEKFFQAMAGFRQDPYMFIHDIFLSCLGSSRWNFTDVSGNELWNTEDDFDILKSFIRSIKNIEVLLNEFYIESSLRDHVIKEVKTGCGSFPSRPGAETADSKEEYHTRALQNLTCVLPLFHWLYARSSARAFQNGAFGPPYGTSKGDHIAFDLKSRSNKFDNAKYYKAEHFPLLFASFDQSPFFINKLFSTKNKSKLKSLLEISTDSLSRLVPKIEVKKVIYEDDQNGRVEVPFEFLNKAEILGPNPRSNAGITNVTFEMLGQNPATVKKYIGCTMELYFDSINSFFKERKVRVNGKDRTYQYKDLLIRKTKYNPIEKTDAIKRIKKLKSLAPTIKKIRESESAKRKFEKELEDLQFRVYNPEYFRVKLNVGWQMPMGTVDDDLRNFIELSNISLYLTLETHDFNFAADGSIQLSLKFMGTMESQLIEPLGTNIFYSEETDRLRLTSNALAEIVTFLKSEIKQAKTAQQKELNQQLTYFLDLKADYIGTIESKLATMHTNLWKSITNENMAMRDTKGNEASIPTHLLRGFANEELVGFGKTILTRATDAKMISESQKKLFKNSKKVVLLAPQVMARIHQQINHQFKNIERSGANDQEWGIDYELVRRDKSGKFLPSNILKDFKFPPKAPPFGKQKDLQSATDISKHLGNSKNAPFHQPKDISKTKGRIEFYFLRYGSIMQTVIHNIWNSNPQGLRDIVFVTGPIRFESIDGKQMITNFSEIPILLDNWKMFMINNVIRQKRQNYPLINYIHDTVGQLLEPALGTLQKGCGDGLDAMSPLKFVEPKIAVFTAERVNGFAPPSHKTKGLRTMHVNIGDPKRFSSTILKKEINTAPSQDHKVKHFVVLYDGSSLMQKFSDSGSLYEQNIKQNVPHFFIGANKGIFRNAAFRKSDVPFYSESKVIDQGDTDGGLLREKYDANLSLFGTAHFLQGMRFYLDPTYTAMAPGNMEQLQRDIGLGGYYTITKVHSSITPQDFVTQVHGAWTSFESGD